VGTGYRLGATASIGNVTLAGLSTTFDVLPIVVTNTNDSGPGSLRQAILDANANPGLDAISFAIPGAGPTFTIAPQTALPAIAEAATIDGSTQPGFAGSPVVELNGQNLPAGTGPGLDVTGNGSTIRALAVNRFDIGIRLGGNANTVIGSNVGTDPAGVVARPNGYGIVVSGNNNVIGGTSTLAMDIVSGNSSDGVHVSFSADGTQVIGSHIGLNVDGFKPLPNGGAGVFVAGTHTDINHSAISANTLQGVMIVNSNNHLWANTIGPYPDGGLNGPLNLGIGNKREGVRIEQQPQDLAPSTNNNVLDSNVIAGNGGNGVVVASGTGTTIASNAIFTNGTALDGGVAPIDLNDDGATANDSGDTDTGPNGLQNYPFLTGAATNVTAGKTYISYQLDTNPGTYHLQFFTGASCGAQALVFDENVTVTGVYSDTIEVPTVTTGITATATDSAGNTSELSNCVTPGTTNAFLWSRADGGKGHLYEYVLGTRTWTSAADTARGRSVNGMAGHLVTIADSSENAFVASLRTRMGLSDMRAWIGLYDTSGTFDWQWVNGDPTGYYNWNSGEPNNPGAERYVEFFAAGLWNNIDNNATSGGVNVNQGYVVEYEFLPIFY
jgi:Lectin C-type domain